MSGILFNPLMLEPCVLPEFQQQLRKVMADSDVAGVDEFREFRYVCCSYDCVVLLHLITAVIRNLVLRHSYTFRLKSGLFSKTW